MKIWNRTRHVAVGVCLAFGASLTWADEVQVAVAANFAAPFQKIAANFEAVDLSLIQVTSLQIAPSLKVYPPE